MCSTSVLAIGFISSSDENFVTEEMLLADKEQAIALTEQGKSLRKVRVSTITLNVPLLYQDDSLWANTLIPGSSENYGSVGCTLTCYAMMYFKGQLLVTLFIKVV